MILAGDIMNTLKEAFPHGSSPRSPTLLPPSFHHYRWPVVKKKGEICNCYNGPHAAFHSVTPYPSFLASAGHSSIRCIFVFRKGIMNEWIWKGIFDLLFGKGGGGLCRDPCPPSHFHPSLTFWMPFFNARARVLTVSGAPWFTAFRTLVSYYGRHG